MAWRSLPDRSFHCEISLVFIRLKFLSALASSHNWRPETVWGATVSVPFWNPTIDVDVVYVAGSNGYVNNADSRGGPVSLMLKPSPLNVACVVHVNWLLQFCRFVVVVVGLEMLWIKLVSVVLILSTLL